MFEDILSFVKNDVNLLNLFKLLTNDDHRQKGFITFYKMS